MNYDIRLRHYSRAFVDAQSLAPTGDDVARLGERLGHPLVAMPVLEPATMRQRVMLGWADFEWQLVILGDSFDLGHNGIGQNGANIGDVALFATEAASVFAAVAEHFGRVPHRLSLVQEGLLREMTAPQMDAVAARLIRVPPSFAGPPAPFEWDWRCARHGTMRIGDTDEETNVLATVKRLSGNLMLEGAPAMFDRIRVDLDVNTVPNQTRGRFAREQMRQFFAEAVRAHEALDAEVSALIGAG
jgi:hypothetical protein